MKLCPACQRCYDDADTVCPQDNSPLVPSRHGPRLIADKYLIERLLGRGGMGAVYAGTHVDLERPVAIKLLLPDLITDADALERFRREARAAARTDHPNIADTYDYGMLPDGGAYIVMELVEGVTLREYMDAHGPLVIGEALDITRQVAGAIQAAHEGGIVHRDLKPSNIVMGHGREDHWQAKVVDFGVAKLKEQTTTTKGGLTSTGSLIGTPRYMSPEQCMGQPTDARSDIYSLGVILYEMLAGHPPFDAPSATAIAIKHIQEPPQPIRELRPDVPETLAQLLAQVLDKDPQARPQSAEELAHRLDEIIASLPEGSTARTVSGDSLAAHDHQTSRNSQGPQTIPPSGPGADTQRSNAPTEESISPAVEIQDGHSVRAYVSPAETLTELSTKVIDPQTSGEKEHPRARESALTAPSFSGPVKESEPLPLSQTKSEGRSLLLLYAGLAAVTIIALVFILGILWPSLNRRASESPSQSGGSGYAVNRNENSQTSSSSPVINSSGQTAQPDNSNLQVSSQGDARSELRSLLSGWVAATNARDVNRQMDFYAPALESFYLQRNASRAAVRGEKARLFSQLSSVNVTVGEPEVAVSADGRTATMRFRKSWTFKGASPESGEVIQELRWRKTDAGWKIISERDLQVVR